MRQKVGLSPRLSGRRVAAAAPWWDATTDMHLDFANDRYFGTSQTFAQLTNGARDSGGLIGGSQPKALGDLLAHLQRANGAVTVVASGYNGTACTLISPDNSNFTLLSLNGAVGATDGPGTDFHTCVLGSGVMGGTVKTCLNWTAANKKIAGNGGAVVATNGETPPTYAANDVYITNSRFGDRPFTGGRIRAILCWRDGALQADALITARSLLGS